MTETQMQKEILNKLMFSERLKYSDIESKFPDHNLFNYHLRELLKKGYIKKSPDGYKLTTKGKQNVSHMEEDGQYQQQFKVGMFIDIIKEENGKYYMMLYKRLKHPHYGYSGSVTGKLKWGDSLEDNLKRELMEELNIVPTEFKNTGVFREVFYNEEKEKVGDGVFFIIVVTKWYGVPNETSEEGEYYWCEIDKILDQEKIFRKGFELGLPKLKEYLKDKENFKPYIVENLGESLKY